MATVAVANLCTKAPLPRGQKKEPRRTSTEGVNDSRTAREFPPTKVIHILQTQRGDADWMRYRRKKTAPVSVRLQCQQPVDGHWKNKTAARGLAEVMVGKTVVYTGAVVVEGRRIVSGTKVEAGESVTIVVDH
jgi:hypothetical protein